MRRFVSIAFILSVAIVMALPAGAFAGKPIAPPQPPATNGISGTVTSAGDGSGIAGASVTAFQYTSKRGWQSKATTLTAGNGAFTMNLGVGTYRVGFAAVNYIAEYHSDAASIASAQDVIVASSKMTACSAVLSNPFLSGGTSVAANGLDAVVSWNAIAGPYEVYRSSTPTDTASWRLVGTTSSTSFTDKPPFRTQVFYKVRSVSANQWASMSNSITLIAGSGSSAEPMLVRCIEDLDSLRDDRAGLYYRQIADIDLSPTSQPGSAFWNGGAGWAPFGMYGMYDGAGFKMSDLYINRPNEDGVGLFSTTQLQTLSDIHLENVYVVGQAYVGALLGDCGGYSFAPERTLLVDCSSEGVVRGSSAYVGGLIGLPTNCTIQSCSTSGSVTGDFAVGGVYGQSEDCAQRNLSSSANVDGARCVGGIGGWDYGTFGIVDSHATGSVTGSGNSVGGLLGVSAYSFIERCWASGAVSGADYIGGLVGHGELVKDSSATGPVTGNNEVGGLVGTLKYVGPNSLTNCFAAGAVSVSPTAWLAGGLVGSWNPATTTITNCYYDGETSGQPVSNGAGSALSTAELRATATFGGWDFVSVWNEPTAESYPTLR